jgi:putative flippase GtrA
MNSILISPHQSALSGPLFAIRGGAPRAFAPPSRTRRNPAISQKSNLYQKWFLIPSLARFSVSGNIGTLCFYFIERFLYSCLLKHEESLPVVMNEYKDSISYFFGYLIQIVTQHLLNALLVYGLDTIDTYKKYIATLVAQFAVYGSSLVGSTLLNMVLLQTGMERTRAFFVTMIVFAAVNYVLINWVVQKQKSKDDSINRTKLRSRGGGMGILFTPDRSVDSNRVNQQTRLAFFLKREKL